MAGSINKVILIGNLGANPELKTLPSGQKVANLRVATSDNWVDQNTGEKRERTEWHSVSVFDKNAASYADNFLHKGDKVYVEGRLQTRQWEDQNGTRKYNTEVIVNSIGGQLIGLTTRIAIDVIPTPATPESKSTTPPENINDTIPF
mgnify:FL=1